MKFKAEKFSSGGTSDCSWWAKAGQGRRYHISRYKYDSLRGVWCKPYYCAYLYPGGNHFEHRDGHGMEWGTFEQAVLACNLHNEATK